VIFRSVPDGANRQAGEWLARLHADDRTPDDDAAFRAWLGADPSHRDAFERASALWDTLPGLRDAARPQPLPTGPQLSRRMVLAGGSALIVAGGATLGWREAYAGVIRTEIGEQRRLVLDDGSRVMLDTDTQIRFRARDTLRVLTLAQGRVDLDIATDRRPFRIDLGLRSATVRSGRLDLRRDQGAIALTALRGVAQIDAGPAGAAPVTLASGSRLAATTGQAARVDRPELDELTAWQSGRLAFHDETLAEAAAEMNRYSRRALVIADPRAAAMRLSGVYRVGDPEAFARSVALLLPIRVEANGDAIRIVAQPEKNLS
jgi:transmembrane sensor